MEPESGEESKDRDISTNPYWIDDGQDVAHAHPRPCATGRGLPHRLCPTPRTELEPTGLVETGDRTLVLIGILGFGLGGVLSLIAVIAFGVLLGTRAHAQD